MIRLAAAVSNLPIIICIFCKSASSIEFDMDLHLYENHRLELVELPIGKGSMDKRIRYAIEEGRKIGAVVNFMSKQDKVRLGFGEV